MEKVYFFTKIHTFNTICTVLYVNIYIYRIVIIIIEVLSTQSYHFPQCGIKCEANMTPITNINTIKGESKPQTGHMAIVNETIEIDPQSVAHGIA